MTHPSRQPGSVSEGLLSTEDWARLTVSSWTEVQSSGGTSWEQARRGCMAHRLQKRATPRDAPLAIGLTPLPVDSRESGPGRPPVRRRCDKAARILDSE